MSILSDLFTKENIKNFFQGKTGDAAYRDWYSALQKVMDTHYSLANNVEEITATYQAKTLPGFQSLLASMVTGGAFTTMTAQANFTVMMGLFQTQIKRLKMTQKYLTSLGDLLIANAPALADLAAGKTIFGFYTGDGEGAKKTIADTNTMVNQGRQRLGQAISKMATNVPEFNKVTFTDAEYTGFIKSLDDITTAKVKSGGLSGLGDLGVVTVIALIYAIAICLTVVATIAMITQSLNKHADVVLAQAKIVETKIDFNKQVDVEKKAIQADPSKSQSQKEKEIAILETQRKARNNEFDSDASNLQKASETDVWGSMSKFMDYLPYIAIGILGIIIIPKILPLIIPEKKQLA